MNKYMVVSKKAVFGTMNILKQNIERFYTLNL